MLVETSGGQIFPYARPPRPTSAPDMWGDNNIEMGGQGDSVPKLCQDNPSGETPKDSEQKKMYSRLFLPGMVVPKNWGQRQSVKNVKNKSEWKISFEVERK